MIIIVKSTSKAITQEKNPLELYGGIIL